MSIVVVGSINVDVTGYLDRLPRPGETLHGERYTIGLGGKGANQAAAAARLGGTVTMIGRVGNDPFGDTALDALGGFGVDTASVQRDTKNATGIALIGVDRHSENMIVVIGGANLALDDSDLDRARAQFTAAKVLLTQREIPLAVTLLAAERARAAGAIAIHDPAPAPPGGLRDESLHAFDIVTPNESEAEALLGFRPDNPADAQRAAQALMARGARIAIVKLGARGLHVAGPDVDLFIPPFRVASVDSVAAGDCFNGGLADALARGLKLVEAARFAAACGALATTRYGAAASAPTRAEVETLLAQG
ncbi:MAG: ribokinase [Dongiaceae bacterium]